MAKREGTEEAEVDMEKVVPAEEALAEEVMVEAEVVVRVVTEAVGALVATLVEVEMEATMAAAVAEKAGMVAGMVEVEMVQANVVTEEKGEEQSIRASAGFRWRSGPTCQETFHQASLESNRHLG